MSELFGFRETMGLLMTKDNMRFVPSDIQRILEVIKLLPVDTEDEVHSEVFFIFGDLLVTQGIVNQKDGVGVLMGFDKKLNIWNEISIDVATTEFVRGFSYGNIQIDNNGNITGAVKRPLKVEK